MWVMDSVQIILIYGVLLCLELLECNSPLIYHGQISGSVLQWVEMPTNFVTLSGMGYSQCHKHFYTFIEVAGSQKVQKTP